MKQQDIDPRVVLDSTPAFICSGRPDGSIDFFNRRWLDEVGAALDALEGWGWTNFIHPADLEEHLRRFRTSNRQWWPDRNPVSRPLRER